MTRNEENRLIAEKCENKRVLTGREVSLSGPWCEMYYESGEAQWGMDRDSLYEVKDGTRGEKKEPCLLVNPLDDYFADIAACVRAAESWEAQVEGREWSTGSRKAVLETVPYHSNNFHIISYDGGTPASNLATALVKAVK